MFSLNIHRLHLRRRSSVCCQPVAGRTILRGAPKHVHATPSPTCFGILSHATFGKGAPTPSQPSFIYTITIANTVQRTQPETHPPFVWLSPNGHECLAYPHDAQGLQLTLKGLCIRTCRRRIRRQLPLLQGFHVTNILAWSWTVLNPTVKR